MSWKLFKSKKERDYEASVARKDKRVLKVQINQFQYKKNGELAYTLSVYYPEDK